MKREHLVESVQLPCPFCGKMGRVAVDEGGGEHQTYVEDCARCCMPRIVHVEPSKSADGPYVWLEREDGY